MTVMCNKQTDAALNPQEGSPDLKRRSCVNGGKNQYPKKSLGLPAKPNKIPEPKLTPKKSHAEFLNIKNTH